MIIVISVSMMKLTAMMLGDDDCPLLLDDYDEDDADVDDGADADADADADAAYGTDDFGQFFKLMMVMMIMMMMMFISVSIMLTMTMMLDDDDHPMPIHRMFLGEWEALWLCMRCEVWAPARKWQIGTLLARCPSTAASLRNAC